MPEVAVDARFARNPDRLRHADALAPLIGQALHNRTVAERGGSGNSDSPIGGFSA